MKRRLIAVIKGEAGQALPIVLVLLALGGLLIAPSLSYASTSLNAGQVVEKKVNGLYAADAGVEKALWYLKFSSLPEGPLEIEVNQMAVTVDTEDMEEEYALYKGGFVSTGGHYYYLAVDGKRGEWNPMAEAYPYTITVTWQPGSGYPVIHLLEVGVRLPVGYEYVPDSAADPSFVDDNLSTVEPDDPVEQDQAGAQMLNWGLPSSPYVSDPDFPGGGGEGPMPIRTQTFYVTGSGEVEGDYTWTKSNRIDIDIVSEVIGTLYRITATATRPEDVEDGDPTATVVADAIVTEGETETEICVILWQINPPEE